MGQQLHLAGPYAGETPRLLVVEPNRVYLAMIARRLSEHGFRIATARSMHEAIAELHHVPADLILSELRLPGSSGVELVRMVREDPGHAHRPVLLIAGRSDRKASVAAFEAGADGVVTKPFHFEVLAARIAREIERARAVERLRHDNAALDARVISRSIEVGELRTQLAARRAA